MLSEWVKGSEPSAHCFAEMQKQCFTLNAHTELEFVSNNLYCEPRSFFSLCIKFHYLLFINLQTCFLTTPHLGNPHLVSHIYYIYMCVCVCVCVCVCSQSKIFVQNKDRYFVFVKMNKKSSY